MKIKLISLAGLICLSFASCSEDIDNFSDSPKEKTLIFGATINNELDQKTYIGSTTDNGDGTKTNKMYWSKGDKISVNGVASEALTESQAGGQSAQFTVTGALTSPYHIVYPAGIYTEASTLTLPTEVTYSSDFANGYGVMVANTEDNSNFSMTNAVSYIKFTVQSQIDEYYVIAQNDEIISGVADVDYANSTITPQTTGKSYVHVSGTIPEDARTFTVAVPTQTLKGFKLVMKDHSTSKWHQATSTKERTLVKGQAVNLTNAINVAAMNEITVISNGQELQDFLVDDNSAKDAIIVADLDVSANTIGSIATYTGTLNGLGHSIKNWTTSTPLVTTNQGTIKNITLESGTFTPATSGACGFIANTNTGTISGCVNNVDINMSKNFTAALYFGSIVGVNNGLVKNCINKGNISISNSATYIYSAIGGVVGQYTGTDGVVSVENCVNIGDVSLKVKGTQSITYLGGVVGGSISHKPTTSNITSNCPNVGKVSGCKNYGAIRDEWTTSASNSYLNFGGVTGYIEGDIENCENNGTVTLVSPNETSAASTRPAVGGVAGYVMYSASNCTNKGKVNCTGSYAGGTLGNQATGGDMNPMFGGVFGGIGWNQGAVAKGESMTYCKNEGQITLNLRMKTTNNTGAYYAGVAGYCCVETTSNCTNSGNITIESCHKQGKTGGIIGYACGSKISECANTGNIEYDGLYSNIGSESTTYSNQVQIGGIVSYLLGGITIEKCTNSGPILLKNIGTSNRSYLGGIASFYSKSNTMKNCENKSNGTITMDASACVIAGGLCGAFNGTMTSCKNYAKVSAPNATSGTPSEIGGLLGYINGTLTSCENHGDITSGEAGTYAGGLAGAMGDNNMTWDGCIIDCDITGNSTKGYVLGRFRSGAATYTITCTNTTITEKTKALKLNALGAPSSTVTVTEK